MYTIFNVSTLFLIVGEKEHFNINLEDEVVRGSIVVTFRVNAWVNVIAMIGTFVDGSICINWIVIIIFTITKRKVK
jgi:hypothetical protein